ncbi:CIS tube protein [Paucibacter sp. XJ19-41]|uniref:CIS tube protein n=1 Tax=Paucibacter sp. XJ19-41 TaxID=2927824 RepID=UPI00234BC890|nr:hypothetical protein [Paucibacter sp. XJ19-41]MDC6171043.1 hypothetical protein [Paucibacter sp. XJ19-41]
MRIPDEHKAKLYRVDQAHPSQEPNADSPDAVLVQFNPLSLSYTAQNTLEKKGRDASARQFVAQTTAKLEFDLQFDSSHDGGDVRAETDRIKQFLQPLEQGPACDRAPPLVGMRWGSFVFKGVLESFRETLDFFSAEGVPLRSLLKIALASQDPRDVFASLPPGHPDARAAAAAVAVLSGGVGLQPGAARSISLTGQFALGGKVVSAGSSGMKADMGAQARIKFD